MSVRLLFEIAGAAFAGALGHEVAHWFVWKLSGRNPTIDWWQLVVKPRAGPPVTLGTDRLAAAAPYIVGALAVVLGVVYGNFLSVVFGLFMIQIPSGVDVAAMFGRVEWRADSR